MREEEQNQNSNEDDDKVYEDFIPFPKEKKPVVKVDIFESGTTKFKN